MAPVTATGTIVMPDALSRFPNPIHVHKLVHPHRVNPIAIPMSGKAHSMYFMFSSLHSVLGIGNLEKVEKAMTTDFKKII